jgi:hypothetical protein
MSFVKISKASRKACPVLGLGEGFNFARLAEKYAGKLYWFGCKNYNLRVSIAF